jgi:hypothetical protein
MCYDGVDRPKSWGTYELDPAFNTHKVALYRDEKKKVAYCCMRGELSPDTVKDVLTKVSDMGKAKYRTEMFGILEKYKDFELHVAGHSYGAVNLLQMILDGVIEPRTLASTYVVNSPIVRDRDWVRAVNKYTSTAPKSFWNIMAQFDFGLGSIFGENLSVTDVWNPYLHFLNNEQTITLAYDTSRPDTDYTHSTMLSRALWSAEMHHYDFLKDALRWDD